MRQRYGTALAFAILGLASLGATPALAVDGVILIDQNRALAGNVTPGDAPGFPVTITLSGSYRLATNLIVPNENTNGIEVTNAADSVSIDLNGFAILGPTNCSVTIPPVCAPVAANPNLVFGNGDGIHSLAGGSLIIRNGTIRGMGRRGIFAAGAPVVTVDGVHVSECGVGGMSVGVGNVFNSHVRQTGGFGIASNQGVLKGNSVVRNGGDGIVSTGLFLNISDNLISQNAGFGISFGAAGTYSNNVISSNLTGAVDGDGLQTSGNVCNGAPCP